MEDTTNLKDKEMPSGSYLSKKGYVIKKDSITNEELVILRSQLRARPLQDDKYNTFNQTDTSYPIYTETKNKIYIPKMYGINRYGDPKRYMPNYIGKSWENLDLNFNGTLFDNQIEPVNALLSACKQSGGGILKAGTGSGKCNGVDTPILMFDGSIKMVQDIVVGELLMGDDSTPRKVLSLARGRDIMYDIIPTKGEKYTVNQEHILCLRASSYPYFNHSGQGNTRTCFVVKWLENNKFCSKYFRYNKNNKNEKEKEANDLFNWVLITHPEQILEIAVKDYIKLSNKKKHILKGYKVPVEFPHRDLEIDPYMIGFWLGDGTASQPEITNQDSTIIKYFKENLQQYKCYLQYKSNKGTNNMTYRINGEKSNGCKGGNNYFLNILKKYDLINNKHIPMIYKCNSRENRLKLLAGLIDSDGSLNSTGCYDFIQKSEKLIDDVIYLARSLGFACYKSKQKKGCWYLAEYKEDDYYRISISGNINEIPTLCPRKRANQRRQIKNVLNTGITVKQLDTDNYYGFEIDGNSRYVLGDFTVTHNTFMSINVLSELKTKTIVVVNKIPLMRQWESELRRFIPNIEIGFIQGQKNVSVEGKDVVIAMLQSLARVDYPDSLFDDFGLVIVDEVHNTSSRVFSQVLSKLCCKYTIGLSATPKRSDGCEYVFKYHIGDIVYASDTKRSGLPPVLNIIRIDSSEYKEINTVNRITGQSQIQYTSMLSDLITMPKRNRLILEMIKDLVLTDNRKILVLSDRREHLKSLKEDFDNDLNISFTYGLFLGQMKQKDLEISRASQVIFATFSAFGEGVSEKELDTLFLITPKKFIGHLKNSIKAESGKLEQIVGRIFRKDHTCKNPMIIDLQDHFSVYKNQSSQRRTFYKQHFKNSITCNNTINLDEYELENLNVKCIRQTRKTTILNDESECQNTNELQLLKHCVIDD